MARARSARSRLCVRQRSPALCPSRSRWRDAKRVSDVDLRAGEEREPWILARDAAVLALLYGSGLRISEALALRRLDAAAPGDVLVVTGKGNKSRMVPLLPQVLQLIASMSRFVRMICRPTSRCSSAPKAARCRRGSCSW